MKKLYNKHTKKVKHTNSFDDLDYFKKQYDYYGDLRDLTKLPDNIIIKRYEIEKKRYLTDIGKFTKDDIDYIAKAFYNSQLEDKDEGFRGLSFRQANVMSEKLQQLDINISSEVLLTLDKEEFNELREKLIQQGKLIPEFATMSDSQIFSAYVFGSY